MAGPPEPAIRPLDATTVLVFAIALYALLAGVTAFYHLTQNACAGSREWALAAVGQAAGILLVATYPPGPAPVLSALLANLLLVGTVDLMYRGLLRYAGEPSRPRPWELAVYAVALALLLYWLAWQPDVPRRVATSSLAQAFAAALAARAAWRLARGPYRAAGLLLAAIFASGVLASAARAAAVLSQGGTQPVVQRSGLQAALLLLLVTHGAAGILGFLLLAARRAQVQAEEALSRVKRLEGIIPICMHCFRVRTDRDSWDRLEKYLAETTDAALSHGVCPDCLEKHYPAFVGE